jgi:hypothetical protein
MLINDKSLQYMTSAELEEAIRRHREHTKKLIAEVRSRRAGSSKTGPANHSDDLADEADEGDETHT